MVLAYVPHNSKIVTDERRPNEPLSAMGVDCISAYVCDYYMTLPDAARAGR